MKQRRVGDATIARVLELNTPDFEPYGFFPDTKPEDWTAHLDWLKPKCMDPASGNLYFPMQSYVLRTRHHTILIDGCVGNDKNRPHRPRWHMKTDTHYMDALAAAGVGLEDIDYVMCTHMHVDHVGWNTRLLDGRWVPTFPNAKYVFHKREYAVWEAEHARGADPPGTVFRDNCLPVVEAGQALLVDDDYALDDTITLTPTPGHSPCHCCVNIFSRGQRAVVTGDLMHHAIQCREPDWSAKPDWDPKQSAVSRRKFFAEVADTDTLILPVHFPAPTVGLLKADGDRFDYRFKRD